MKKRKREVPWGLIALGGLGVWLLSRKKPSALDGLGAAPYVPAGWITPSTYAAHAMPYTAPATAPSGPSPVPAAAQQQQPAGGDWYIQSFAQPGGAPQMMIRREYTTVTRQVPADVAAPSGPPMQTYAQPGSSSIEADIAPYVSTAKAADTSSVEVVEKKEESKWPWWLIPLGLAIAGQ